MKQGRVQPPENGERSMNNLMVIDGIEVRRDV
ncbi:KilA-N domain-containing protein, partial [Salmonella enterica subsp. enterica serovar Derby]|nr:KilA-N domain-containing protein [Salmonella enterica subsp. enterica serovar Derby]EDE0005112.1 KilA-N domain-containing protein [Salmonella enterica subsp. enterica serovar Typhimurium]